MRLIFWRESRANQQQNFVLVDNLFYSLFPGALIFFFLLQPNCTQKYIPSGKLQSLVHVYSTCVFFKTKTAFSMRFGLSFTCKHAFRSLKTEPLGRFSENSTLLETSVLLGLSLFWCLFFMYNACVV